MEALLAIACLGVWRKGTEVKLVYRYNSSLTNAQSRCFVLQGVSCSYERRILCVYIYCRKHHPIHRGRTGEESCRLLLPKNTRSMAGLTRLYPWLQLPVIVSAPMLGAATPVLAMKVSTAGGLGFIAGGTKLDALEDSLRQAARLRPANHSDGIIPIGVGFQLWSCKLSLAVEAFRNHLPAVAWLYAPSKQTDLAEWADGIRDTTKGKTHIWVQVGSVAEARSAVSLAKPDVLVVQGSDAGGHGLSQSAGIISLVPEVMDMLASIGHSDLPVLAAGGISDGRGVAGALALGASGVVMGTRFLAAEEAGIPHGWQNEVLRLTDGGQSTTRSTLCDRLKETKGWPACYDGRAAINQGHHDESAGMPDQENVARYKQESAQGDSAWGPQGRMVTYAGTGVGLVREVKPAAHIVEEVRTQARTILKHSAMSCDAEGGRPML